MAIATAQQFIAIVQLYASSIFAALIWDWLTSLHREVVVIWRAEWNVLKGLYFVARYYGIVSVIVALACCVDIEANHRDPLPSTGRLCIHVIRLLRDHLDREVQDDGSLGPRRRHPAHH